MLAPRCVIHHAQQTLADMHNIGNRVLICRDCDAVHRVVPLKKGDLAVCRRCDGELSRYYSADPGRELALVIAAAIFCAIANFEPVLSIEVGGVETSATIWSAVYTMREGWMGLAALGLALTTLLIPALQIATLLWLLPFSWTGRQAPGFALFMKVLYHTKAWSMTEVFLLGALVVIVKLAKWMPINTGIGIWAMGALVVLLTVLGRCDPSSWWSTRAGTRL